MSREIEEIRAEGYAKGRAKGYAKEYAEEYAEGYVEGYAEVFSSVDGVGHAAALGKEPYGSGSSDVCLPIPDGKYVTKFV